MIIHVLVALFLFSTAMTIAVSSAVAADEAVMDASVILQPDVEIIFNGGEMVTENALFMSGGTLYIPARFFLESIGAVVQWDSAGAVLTTVWEGIRLQTFLKSPGEARANGRSINMSGPGRIVNGKVYLPLRFLAETMGGAVTWDVKGRRVEIVLEKAPAITYLRADLSPAALEYDYYRGVGLEIETLGIRIGDSSAAVLQILGEPDLREETIYGSEWWVYYQDPLNYMQVEIEDSIAAALYLYGDDWSFGPIKAGDKLQKLNGFFTLAESFTADKNLKPYKFPRPTLLYPDLLVSFYHDSGAGDALIALRLERLETAKERVSSFLHFRYAAGGDRAGIDEDIMRQAEYTDERQLFDLVNVMRARKGFSPLGWHEGASMAALGHSREMYLYDYFSHTSPVTGKALPQRLDDENVRFRIAAETLCRGQIDAPEAFHDLINSPEHRKAVLDESYQFAGVGVFGDCFTQNFLSE